MKSGSKSGIWIGLIAVAFIIIVFLITSLEPKQDEQNKFQSMSETELGEIAVKWKYRDLIQNSTGFENKVIFISGTVIEYPFINDFVGVQTGCSNVLQYRECDVIFVQTDVTYSVNDKISGYVLVEGLHELISKKPMTGALVGEEVPRVQQLKLNCDLC